MELKLHGIIIIYSFDKVGKVRLYSRDNNEVTSQFSQLAALNIQPGTVLDDELIVSDTAGKPDLEAMMARIMISKANSSAKSRVTFITFDVLEHKGKQVTHLPLLELKEILADPVRYPSNRRNSSSCFSLTTSAILA